MAINNFDLAILLMSSFNEFGYIVIVDGSFDEYLKVY